MKKLLMMMLAILILLPQGIQARYAYEQDEISDYFDLQVLASTFYRSKSLKDLEKRINNPSTPVSNLDLNQDGYVDYLRVIKQTDINVDMIIIQAVLDRNLYQDVATIYVERDRYRGDYIIIIGDSYIFGEDYYLEPRFAHTPRIIRWLWYNSNVDWISPYYWDFYPSYYYYYRPLSYINYMNGIHMMIDPMHNYYYVRSPRIHLDIHWHRDWRRHDMEVHRPDWRFDKRNKDMRNKLDIRRNDQPERNIDRGGGSRNNNNQSQGVREQERRKIEINSDRMRMRTGESVPNRRTPDVKKKSDDRSVPGNRNESGNPSRRYDQRNDGSTRQDRSVSPSREQERPSSPRIEQRETQRERPAVTPRETPRERPAVTPRETPRERPAVTPRETPKSETRQEAPKTETKSSGNGPSRFKVEKDKKD